MKPETSKNLSVYINGVRYEGEHYGVQLDSFILTDQISERSYASFILQTPLNVQIKKYSTVEIYKGDELLLRGIVDTAYNKAKHGIREHEITVIDNHYFVDKRVYAKAFVQTKTGEIVKQIVDDVLHEEGIWYDDESIQEGISTTILFNYDYCNNVLEKLAERTGYVWWVDDDKKLYFQDPQTVRNPDPITPEIIRHGSLVIEYNLSQFRNTQYVKGAMDLTGEITTLAIFDGTNTNFVMNYPVGELVNIRIKYAGESEFHDVNQDNIGKKNEDELKPIMWAYGDNTISIDRSFLVTGDELEFVYRGLIPIIGLSVNQRQIENLAQLEGGSGKVENIVTEPELIGAISAIQSANAKNQKYGDLDAMTIKLITAKSGYRAGELVRVIIPDEEINEDFLIETVEIYEQDGYIWYDLTLVRGAVHESWARRFQRALERIGVVLHDEIKLEEVIVVARDYSKIWYPGDVPNPFQVLYPGENTFPGALTYPGFKEENRIYKVVITVDGKRYEFTKSRYYDTDEGLLTLFYINPGEANGEWQKIEFYGFSNGIDILFDTILVDFTKNELEAIQIQRMEIRGDA